jgi:hypothetical protein
VTEAKLIQVTSMTTKHANKDILSRLEGLFPHFSLGVEGWFWIGWVVNFGGFNYFLLFVVVGGRNKFGGNLLTLVLTPLKLNTQFISELGCTTLNSTQIIINHFLAHNSSLKTRSQVSNLMLQLGVLFGSMEMLTIERATHFTWRR